MLIGINGFKGAGKDTIADYLVDEWGFTKVAFATKLKQLACEVFRVDMDDMDFLKNYGAMDAYIMTVNPESMQVDEDFYKRANQSYTFRGILQGFGEGARRVFGDDFWVDQVLPKDVIPRGNIVVVDARYENEIWRIRDCGGVVWRVERPGVASDGHASEQEPDPALIDKVIINDKAIEDLHAWVEELMQNASDRA